LENWIDTWQKNNWRTSAKEDVKNVDLWKSLLIETQKHEVKFVKVKGHADNEYNNRCDKLAKDAIKQIQSGFYEENNG
jgi:ribonuclease HI